MLEIVFTRGAMADLERIFEFHAVRDLDLARTRLAAIRSAVSMLAEHPFLGRRVEQERRELVISVGKSGFVALYRVHPARGLVTILRVRHQRELGFPA